MLLFPQIKAKGGYLQMNPLFILPVFSFHFIINQAP